MKDYNSYDADKLILRKKMCELQKENADLLSKNSELENSVLHEKFQYNDMEKYYLNQINNLKSKKNIMSKFKNLLKRIVNKFRKINKISDFYETNNPEIAKDDEVKSYISHYEDNEIFKGKTDIKTLAFYLPQFHTFKENDEWWGKGFTEWTNTKKSVPRFNGHYQPREPHDDIGYYDLKKIDKIENQIKLAKQHGIYGFAFYYYWFSGKKLMELPIKNFLKVKSDFKFCLCWANESWTRRWDGLEGEKLIEQEYKDDDPVKFIKDIKEYLINDRYIKINNKPLLMIYNPQDIPDFGNVVNTMRKTAREIGVGELYIASNVFMGLYDLSNEEYVDAEFDFAPNGFSNQNWVVNNVPTSKGINYSKMVRDLDEFYSNYIHYKNFYFSCTTGWDNSPRRKDEYRILTEYTPYKFYKWIRYIVRENRKRYPEDERFLLVNAWNEWAEGTYLEPDKKYGYTNINTLSRAIYDLSYISNNIVNLKDYNDKKYNDPIAIQIHVYYLDIFEQMISKLEQINIKYDLYISTDTEDKKSNILKLVKKLNYNNITISVIDNKGMDIYPFIYQLKDVYKNYKYILKLHTKKTRDYDLSWGEYLVDLLIGQSDSIQRIIGLLENYPGIVYPNYLNSILDMVQPGNNENNIKTLLDKMNLDYNTFDFEYFDFPAGSMFLANSESIEDILELDIDKYQFEDSGLKDNTTIAHAVERLFGIIPKLKGYNLFKIAKRK